MAVIELQPSLEDNIKENEKLVYYVVKRFAKRAHMLKVEFDDLVSEGMIGLIKAIKNFDSNYGVKFSTYAVSVIEGHLRRILRDANPGLKFSRKAKEMAMKITGYETVEEVMEQFKTKRKYAEEALAHKNNFFTVSMEKTFSHDDDKDLTIGETVGYEEDFSSVEINDFLVYLPEKLKVVAELIMKDKTQHEIGELIGCSQVHVSRLINKIRQLYQEYLKGEKEMPKVAFNMSVYEYVDLVSKHTIRDIAKQKGISEATLYNWIKANKDKINELLRKEDALPDEKKPSKCNYLKDEQKAEYERLIKQLEEKVKDDTNIIQRLEAKVKELENLHAACDDVENEVSSLREEKNKLSDECGRLLEENIKIDRQVENWKYQMKNMVDTMCEKEKEIKALRKVIKLWA